ncbi:MAG: TMEM175 family protein [Gammaproteobacteria bacterium]|nr:TMEM175 family protein [Gammaproteobacteria bacterium]
MRKSRLEAFSDGVLAIIITIMVLDLKIPHGIDLYVLKENAPIFLSYVLSFLYLAIYWNNHHHLFQVVTHVNGPILWANMHLLFWLSLIPFVTAWSGTNDFAPIPVAVYGCDLFMAATAYFILTKVLVSSHHKKSNIVKALSVNLKEKTSTAIYAAAIFVALWLPAAALALYFIVACMWIVPDKRIERVGKILKS